jgi:hypothetical protein
MNFSASIRLGAATALTAFAVAMPAQAAVVISSINTSLTAPSGLQAAPTTATGNFRLNQVGDDLNGISPDSRSPYSGTEYSGTAPYNSVSKNSTATYVFSWAQSSLAFMWGSPDDYNFLDFYLGNVKTTFSGEAVTPPAIEGLGFVNVVFTGLFDKVVFRNGGQDALEYTNMQVPEPGSLALLGLGLAGLAAASRRKQKQA